MPSLVSTDQPERTERVWDPLRPTRVKIAMNFLLPACLFDWGNATTFFYQLWRIPFVINNLIRKNLIKKYGLSDIIATPNIHKTQQITFYLRAGEMVIILCRIRVLCLVYYCTCVLFVPDVLDNNYSPRLFSILQATL